MTTNTINTISLEKIILSKPVVVTASMTQHGINILLSGGTLPHIGSVSIIDDFGNLETKNFESHKDYVIGNQWALELYNKYKVPIVVIVGIHYDNLSKKQIKDIVADCNELLNELNLQISSYYKSL